MRTKPNAALRGRSLALNEQSRAIVARVARIPRVRSIVCALKAALAALPAMYALVQGSYQAYLNRQLVLDPDVLAFQSIAHDMTLDSVFGGVREPLWPVLFVIPVRILGDQSPMAIRLMGVLGFVFMIIVFQLLARELYGRTWSIIAGLLLAASPWLVFQGARGLREEASAGLVLLFCLGLIRPGLTGRRIVLLFALAGLTGLLRWDALDIMLPVLAVALIIRRPHPAAWIAGPAVVALLIGPLLLANYIQTGDPLYHSNFPARLFKNIEFHDQPGFPTSAELAVDSFAGGPITWTQYVFGLHSTGELWARAVRAVWNVPVRVMKLALFYPGPGHPPGFVATLLRAPLAFLPYMIWPFGLVGGFALLRTRAWPVPLMLGGIVLLYSPVADLVDYRLLITVLPLFVLCVMETLLVTEKYWLPVLRAIAVAYYKDRNHSTGAT